MNQQHIQAVLEGIVPEVRAAIASAQEPLIARIAEIEARSPVAEKGEPGRDGIDGKDGQSVTIDDVRPLLDEAINSIPVPKDGEHGQNGANGRDGIDGKDAPIPTTDQVLDALKAMDADAMIRSALTSESHKGGIDVLAPWDVSQEMTNAVQMLAEPFPTKAAEADMRNGLKPRSFRFERDAQNRIVAAYQE